MPVREITWNIHLSSPPEEVYTLLSSPDGRKRFWAESADETEGEIRFRFINGQHYTSKILAATPPVKFEIEYFNSRVRFELNGDNKGGTDLRLTNYDINEEDYLENHSGWVSVLLALKAAVDFGIDIRNHDPLRTWDQRFVDN